MWLKKLQKNFVNQVSRASSTVQTSMEEALVRILTPRRSIDILRDVHAAKERGKPYVVVLVGVNGDGVGKSTNLSKVAYWLLQIAKRNATDGIRKDIKQLTQTYTSNTSSVAIPIATITFAAAFTLPGGYSSDAESDGLPIVAKFAFQAFLVSDTLAMCCSLAVAFVCITTKWEDSEFLIHYISFTKKLMWLAYTATTTAFATGLYTVVAPRVHWNLLTTSFTSSSY